MSEGTEQKRSWVDLLALVIAFIGVTISFFWSISIYISQAETSPGISMWPLPGLALVDWVLMGTLGFIAVFFSLRKDSKRWRNATWIFTGAFIPLIILGLLSIGLMVFISFLFMLISTAILTWRARTSWLASFGLIMLGSIGNLAIMMGIIFLSS